MSDTSAVMTMIALDALPSPVYVKNRQGNFIYANDAFIDLVKVERDQIIGHSVHNFAPTRIASKSTNTDTALTQDNPQVEVVVTYMTSDNCEYIIQAKKCLIEVPQIGECILCVMNDISQFVLYEKELEEKHRELRRQQGKLKELATIDPLTGIFNRRAFYDKAKEIINYAKVGDLDVGVLMFDLDQFKRLNDTHGHAVGDEVLIRFTKVVADCCRSSDIFARLGGEEFALLLPDTSEDATRRIAERIRKRVEHNTVTVNGETVQYTTSVGGTMWFEAESKIDYALNRADKYLYQAKNEGRNKVVFCLAGDHGRKISSAVA